MSEKFQEIISSSQPTLVDFYATWCGPCQRMHPILEEVKSRIGDKAKIIKVDVDQNEALTAEYQVQTIPTRMLFNAGDLLWSKVGVQTASSLVSEIESNL